MAGQPARDQTLIRQLQGMLSGGHLTTGYAPTWTGSGSNPAIGNGTLGGSYMKVGELVFATWNVIAGSTTTFGTGTYTLTLPFPAATGLRWSLAVDLLDAGTQHYVGTAIIASAGTTFEEIIVGSSASGPTSWGTTTPFTFGDGDRIVISGVYAAAP